MLKQVAVLAAVLLAAAAPNGRQGGVEPVTVRLVRFYSPGSGTTTIEGVCEVRPGALHRAPSSVVRYRMQVVVEDSAGLELQRSEWPRELPASIAHARGASVVETFSVRVAPGRYRVRVRVEAEGGTAAQQEVEARAFDAAPRVSDLVLGTGARALAGDSAEPGPSEIRRGNLALRTAPAPRLSLTSTSLVYYAEVYGRGTAATARLATEVLTAEGRSLVRTPPREVPFSAAGGVTQGSLDLTGLPEGSYRLRVAIVFADTTLQQEAAFSMAPVAAVAAAAEAERPAAPADLFDAADESRLDSLFGPLVYLTNDPASLSLYRRLTLDGKRRWLREFWQNLDPTPATADNPARDDFYRAVAQVNTAYRESGRGDMPGWNTDRGRIHLRNGAPSDVLRRPAGSPKPYEVWKYTRTRQLFYVFLDPTGFGNYMLIGTNDNSEQGRPGWANDVGYDTLRDIAQFLGVDVSALQR
jgi:GWxTD domain-containing protein